MEEDELITNLRAIIISSKGGLPLNHVKGDYRDTFGTEIPLRKFGYSSLEDFFKKKSEDFKLFSNRVEAIPKSTSLHISSLVSEQNDRKRRTRPKTGSKRQRRPLHSGTHSIYKPLVSHHSFSKKPSFDVAPRFRKQIDSKQILSIGKVKNGFGDSPVKSDREEPEPKFCKRDETPVQDEVEKPKPLETKGTRTRTERNQFLAKTLEQQGMIPRKAIAEDDWKRKNESEDVFQNFPSGDDIPFDAFEVTEIFPSGAQSRLSRHKTKISVDSETKTSRSSGTPGSSNSSSLPVTPFLSSPSPFSDFEEKPPLPYKKTAQSRLERIKSSFGTNEEIFDKNFEEDEEIFPATGKTDGGNAPPKEWIERLKDLCLSHGYPEPIYEDTRTGSDCCFSKVIVGDKFKLSSFPVEQPDERGARESAAKKAYQHISAELNSVKSKRTEAELISRISKLVSTSYGIWSYELPRLYSEEYGEALDRSWFSTVQNSPEFEISRVDDSRFIVHKKIFTGETEDEGEIVEEIQRKSVITTTLRVPASIHWEIYVVNVKNSSQVWCRLIGEDYSDKYDAIMTQLELEPPKTRVKTPVLEEIYAAYLEDTWNRVKLISIKENTDEGTIFFIDSGEEEDVELSELYYLEPYCLDLPAQAIPLSLHELDCFAEDQNLTALLLSKLLGHIYIAEVVLLCESGTTSVVFWDTSTEEDVNVNKTLLDAIVAEIHPPRLEKCNQIKEVFVSEVTDQGDIFIVISKEAIQRIDSMILKQTATGCDKRAVCVPDTVNLEELYLTRCEKTGNYGRAKVMEKKDSDHVDVLFVDRGIVQRTKMDDMYCLSILSPSLASIPPQAMKVRLAVSKVWNSKMARKLRDMVPGDEVVLVKRIEGKGDVLYVDIFRRSSQDNSLSSVTTEFAKLDGSQQTESRSRKKSEAIGQERVLYDNLSPPPVPEVGKYYDVYVTLAASPDLFTVQPLRSMDELSAMMDRLQDVCGKPEGSSVTDARDCIVGNLYAVKHSDDNWYRGVLQAALGSSTFSVYLCDYGDFAIAPLERLVPLPEKPDVFTSLPYQAIRAKLHGVVPSNKDWSVMDCVYFQELVVDKELVATVEEIIRDPNNANNITLGLTLTDTSGQDDVYIHKLLIDRKSAILAPKKS